MVCSLVSRLRKVLKPSCERIHGKLMKKLEWQKPDQQSTPLENRPALDSHQELSKSSFNLCSWTVTFSLTYWHLKFIGKLIILPPQKWQETDGKITETFHKRKQICSQDNSVQEKLHTTRRGRGGKETCQLAVATPCGSSSSNSSNSSKNPKLSAKTRCEVGSHW